MPKRKVKKRKLKIIPFLIIILVLIILGVLLKLYLDRPIQNIVINGTKYINDDYILEQANLKDYPSFFKTFSFNVEKQLKKSIYIKDVKLRKKLFRTINIKVKENRPLFYDNYNNKTIFENHKSINQDELIYKFNIPRLVNYIPKEKYIDWVSLYGNMVSASIPFVLCKLLENGELKNMHKILLFGTAAGLTINGILLNI